jgi:dihydroorotate dehydrogenase/NAD-dependent dihydropyrimidine dehydrogenase PreA subunit
MAQMAVEVSGIQFRNPVLTAAGPHVRTPEMMIQALEGGAGGVVSKTVSLKPARDLRPTIRKTLCKGVMNCETWSETPVEDLMDGYRRVVETGVPLIVSIGYQPDEVKRLGSFIEREVGPAAIEFSTHYVGRSVDPLLEVAQSLRASVTVPLWMKISPNVPNIEELAERVSPFVDGFVAVNSYGPVLDFDVEDHEALLGSTYGQGWLSGPPILPIALWIVYRIASVQEKPVIGVGGIGTAVDALKFFMVGASAIQICTAAILHGHSIYGTVADGISDWLDDHGYASLQDIQGVYRTKLLDRELSLSRAVMSIDGEKCTGCKACVSRCIQGALYMEGERAMVAPGRCIGCGFCQDFCAQDAMELRGV